MIESISKNYTYIPNGYLQTETNCLIDLYTGEAVPYTDAQIPDGSSIYTPRDKEAKKKRKQNEILRNRSDEKYYFVRSDTCFSEISAAIVTKLIYLSTFVRYADNALMLSQRTHIKRKDLASILRISERSSYDFWKQVSPTYITENANRNLILNTEIFKRGSLKRKAYTPYQQFYDKGVRKLYEATNGSYHKQLGYIFQLLPYINIEYNLVCYNQFETDIDKIKLMSILDFCKLINYDVTHIDRLLKVYNTVRFDVNGRQERFCTMIYNGIDKRSAKICVNPAVFYTGTNYGRVEVTKLFFRD